MVREMLCSKGHGEPWEAAEHWNAKASLQSRIQAQPRDGRNKNGGRCLEASIRERVGKTEKEGRRKGGKEGRRKGRRGGVRRS